MLVKPRVNVDNFSRPVSIGDLLGAAEIITSLATAGAGTLTGAILATNILSRTGPTGAVADTVDVATNIIAAIPKASSGDSYRLRYINNVAYAITVTAATGVTVTSGVVNASSVKDFLVQITNATPQSVVPGCVTTNSSKIITGMTQAQTDAISIGQLMTGTGAGSGAKVVGIQPGIGVTVDVNSSATATGITMTFSPTVSITGLGQGLL